MKQHTLKRVTILALVTTLFSSMVVAGYWFQEPSTSNGMVFDQVEHATKPCHAQRHHCNQCVTSLFCHGVGIPTLITLTQRNSSIFQLIPYIPFSIQDVVLAEPMKPPRN